MKGEMGKRKKVMNLQKTNATLTSKGKESNRNKTNEARKSCDDLFG